ncbi:MAG: SPOR domain-containing protein [candidate division Zixibacteria bacterium]
MKNTFRILFLIQITALFGMISCNRYRVPNSPEALEDRRTTKESRYNLMGFAGDRDVITSDVAAADDTLKEESTIISLPEYISSDQEIEEIFAVQVFASKSSEEAFEFEQSVAPLFDEETITDYKPPYYKVRIGNCANLEEAEALLEKVKDFGYRNAWLVRIRIQ